MSRWHRRAARTSANNVKKKRRVRFTMPGAACQGLDSGSVCLLGRPILAAGRLLGGQSRLKAGCGQNCPPHKTKLTHYQGLWYLDPPADWFYDRQIKGEQWRISRSNSRYCGGASRASIRNGRHRLLGGGIYLARGFSPASPACAPRATSSKNLSAARSCTPPAASTSKPRSYSSGIAATA